MDDVEYKNLARKARTLYRLTNDIQKTMLQMFFYEFVELDQEEQQQILIDDEPPF